MLGRLTGRSRIAVVVLLLAVAGYVFYHFLFVPQIEAYAVLRTKLEKSRTELARAQAMVAGMKSENARLQKIKKDLNQADSLFETEMRYGADVIQLGLRAAADDIEITAWEPGTIRQNARTLEMPVSIVAEGDFRNLLAFCNDIENLSSLAEIRRLKCEALAPSAGDMSSGRVKGTLAVVFYSSRTPAGTLRLKELARWSTGRDNIFLPAAAVSPIEELAGHLRVPPPPPEPDTEGLSPSKGGAPVTESEPAVDLEAVGADDSRLEMIQSR